MSEMTSEERGLPVDSEWMTENPETYDQLEWGLG